MPLPSRPAPTIEALNRYAEDFNQSLTLRFFGARIEFPSVDRVRIVVPVRPEHRGGMGTDAVNGGILAAIFDLALGCAAALADPTRRSATMQISMSFEQGLRGDLLVGESWLDRVGGRTAFASAVLKNEAGDICARAQGVVRLTDLPWAGGASPAIN
jgi:uncharacterized protein (TIGR00369 family)